MQNALTISDSGQNILKLYGTDSDEYKAAAERVKELVQKVDLLFKPLIMQRVKNNSFKVFRSLQITLVLHPQVAVSKL